MLQVNKEKIRDVIWLLFLPLFIPGAILIWVFARWEDTSLFAYFFAELGRSCVAPSNYLYEQEAP